MRLLVTVLPACAYFELSSQDTNVTQYELMTAIAVTRCITVVGDPDQSSQPINSYQFELGISRVYVVYGWRSAEVGNLARMQKGTHLIITPDCVLSSLLQTSQLPSRSFSNKTIGQQDPS